MIKNILLILLCLFFFPTNRLQAQFVLNYNAEANVIAGNGDYTPFYLMNNRAGVISFSPNNGYLRAGISKDVEKNKRFSYGFALDIVGAYSNPIPAYIQQLYGELKYRCLGISIGSKEEYSLIEDRSLSSGSMVWSGNSRPIPQVWIGIPHFTEVPGTKGWMQLKGGISYGAFTDNRYQKKHKIPGGRYSENVLYHRKNLLLRFGKQTSFYGIIGIDMAAQFGGTVYNSDPYFPVMKFEHNLKAFLKVLVPSSGGSNIIDQVNIVGNHLGSYLMEFGYNKNLYSIRAYYEHYYDDHSGMIFKNKFDGLWGIEFRSKAKKYLTGFVFEIMNSTHQSGPFLWDKTDMIPIQVSDGDNYYAHAAYNGWTHAGHTMGTPFISSPGYNRDHFLGFTNNRSRAFHTGIDGYITPKISYRILAGHQRGWGTPNIPFKHIAHQFSGLAEARYSPTRLHGWEFLLSAAFDKGTLFDDNWGVQFGIRKSGILFRK